MPSTPPGGREVHPRILLVLSGIAAVFAAALLWRIAFGQEPPTAHPHAVPTFELSAERLVRARPSSVSPIPDCPHGRRSHSKGQLARTAHRWARAVLRSWCPGRRVVERRS